MRQLLIFCFGIFMLQGQSQSRYALLFKSGEYEIKQGNIENLVSVYQDEIVFNKYIRIIQFNQVPSEATKRLLENNGAIVLGYIPKNAYLVSLTKNSSIESKRLDIRSVTPFLEGMKLSKNLSKHNYPGWSVSDNKITLAISFFPHFSKTEKQLLLAQLKSEFSTDFKEIYENEIEVTVPLKDINRLSKIPYVMYIQAMEDPGEIENYRASTSHRVNAISTQSSNPYQLDGSSVHVSLGDYDYGVAGPHIDFTGRLNDKITGADNGTNHGIHTMGTVFGAGNLDPRGQGMAPGAELTYYTYPANLTFIDNDYANDNVRITSSSFSNNCNTYTNFSNRVDKDMVDNPKLIHVFSAGNNNGSNCGYGAGNQWGNITGGHKQGKNVIAVANLTNDDNIANSSSRGPAHDGRVKPDIGGVGTSVYSTEDNNTYGIKTGTSMSCPGIAGTLSLLYQGYKNYNNGAEPDGGLAKAILMNTAEDLGNDHVDFKYGYGRINAFRAMQCIELDQINIDNVSGGNSNTYNIDVPAGTKEVRVMLHWTDPQAFSFSSRALINDLDLTVKHLASNTIYQPWVLDPTPNSTTLNNTAVRATDSLNNTEQFTLVNPDSGIYTITVQGSGIPQGSQKYYIVYSFISNNLNLMAPYGGEVLDPVRNFDIRFEGVNLTGNSAIDYSTDNGSTWINIVTGLNASTRNYSWNIPNSVFTTEAKVRVTNGAYTSISNTFSILRVPSGLSIDWVCIDSMQVSWNPVLGAMGYVLHQLGTEYMDSVGTTAQTNFVYKGINPSQSEWISVSALDSLGKNSVRSKAIQSPIGLVNCSLPYDVEVSQILHPLGNYSDCLNPGSVSPTVMLTNRGTSPIDSIMVFFTVGQTTISMLYTNLIQPGDSAFVSFASTISLAYGQNSLVAWSSHPKDDIWLNDTSQAIAKVTNSTSFNTPYQEDFESFIQCPTTTDCEATDCPLPLDWVNEENYSVDAIDFRTNTGPTPTNGTGPSNDHTTGNGNYLYLESSACYGRYGILESPCIKVMSTNKELVFWYHMLGSEMGRLHIDILYDGKIDLDVTNVIQGNQGNIWREKRVALSKYAGKDIVVQFRGVTGSWHRSDIAIDDVSVGDVGISIEENESLNSITLKPNPASSMVTLSWKGLAHEKAEIKIFNNLGQLVLEENWSNEQELLLDIDQYSKGLYFIHVYYGDEHEFLKFIKQ